MVSCRKWSLTGDKRWQGLCSMLLAPETANPTKDCGVCVTPAGVQLLDECNTFAFMKKNPTDQVVIPNIWTIEWLPAVLTQRSQIVCNRTSQPGTVTKDLIPQLIGTKFRVSGGTNAIVREFKSEPMSIGQRQVSYVRKQTGTNNVLQSRTKVWNVTCQFIYQLGIKLGVACSQLLRLRYRRTAISDTHPGFVFNDGPHRYPCASTFLYATFYDNYQATSPNGTPDVYQDIVFPLYRPLTGTNSLFTEWDGVTHSHSPWRYRFGSHDCGGSVSWAHSIDCQSESSLPDVSGQVTCTSLVESFTPSNGLSNGGNSPTWIPSTIHFAVTGT